MLHTLFVYFSLSGFYFCVNKKIPQKKKNNWCNGRCHARIIFTVTSIEKTANDPTKLAVDYIIKETRNQWDNLHGRTKLSYGIKHSELGTDNWENQVYETAE